jgi:hypothetical protein
MNVFYGIETFAEGQVVQGWFDALNFDAQLEILNMVLHLERLPMGRWRRPDYDPLEGEGGISELRPKDIRGTTGNVTYRLYGLLKHPHKNAYTFLHGTDKETKNDVDGKEHSRQRMGQLFRNEARTHKFDFTPKAASDTKSGEKGKDKIRRITS